MSCARRCARADLCRDRGGATKQGDGDGRLRGDGAGRRRGQVRSPMGRGWQWDRASSRSHDIAIRDPYLAVTPSPPRSSIAPARARPPQRRRGGGVQRGTWIRTFPRASATHGASRSHLPRPSEQHPRVHGWPVHRGGARRRAVARPGPTTSGSWSRSMRRRQRGDSPGVAAAGRTVVRTTRTDL